MNQQSLMTQLERLISMHSILQHPFYQAWSAGDLTKEDLSVYAWVYYPHVAAFPNYIERALKHEQEPEVRKILEDNLQDELSNPEPHPDLWLQFAAGLGVDRQEVLDAEPVPEVKQAVEMFQQVCDQGIIPALTALYAYESQQPEVSCSKMDGLRKFYDIHDPQTLSYFQVHHEADQKHREEERWALLHCLETEGASSHTVIEAAQTALDAHWLLLDGVCRQAGISC